MERPQKKPGEKEQAVKRVQDLRAKAERMLSEKKPVVPPVSVEDSAQLIHELRVHQIELQMQNEELREAQKEIEESRSRFVDLFDFAPIPYFTFDGNGVILEANFKGAELLGFDRQALIGKPFGNFVKPPGRDAFRKHRNDALRLTSRQRCELQVKRKDGTVLDVVLESIAGKDSEGDATQVRSAVWDVTELRAKEEIIRAEQTFREAIENSVRLGVVGFDSEGRHIYANPAFCRMVGWSRGELMDQKAPFPYWPGGEKKAISDVFLDVLSHQKRRDSYEFRFQNRKGRPFDVLVIFSELKDLRGEPLGWLASVGDITERKKREEEVRRLNEELEEKVRRRTADLESVNKELAKAKEAVDSEHRYLKTILETVPAAVVVAEGSPPRMRFMNRQGLGFYGGESASLEPPFELPADKLPIFRLDGTRLRVEEYPAMRALLKGEEVRGAEIVTGSPGERVISVSASPLRDKKGKILAGVGAAIDITERKQAEDERLRLTEEIQAERDKLQALINSITDEVWFADTRGNFTLANQSALREFGIDSAPNEIEIEKLAAGLEVYRPDGSLRSVEETPPLRALRGEVIKNQEEMIKRPASGELRYREVSSSPVRDADGKIIGSVSVARDVTERKEAENQIRKLNEELNRKNLHLEEAIRELEAYSSTVSHDLKNPLVVMGNVTGRLLKKYGDNLDAKGKEYLDILQSTCGRMTELVDDLLDLSRISKITPKKEKVDLSSLAEAILFEYRQKEPDRQVKVALAGGMVCRADRRLLRVLLDNLLSNACKFTKNCDPARIEIGSIRQEADLVFFVRDNGCGFAVPPDSSQPFAPFQRYHDPGQYPGTGIGLATVSRIILRHGGRVWLESAVGKGTTVYFTLPEN
jgi:PAS domain S-box-containing protein